jgi:hypothetical protein
MAEGLVALRDRRSEVIAQLSEGYGADLIDIDELERRLDLAHGAASIVELDALVADLAGIGSTALVPASTALTIEDPERMSATKLRVLFGSVRRGGRWTVANKVELRVAFGNAELDFREASLAAGVTTIDVRITCGNLEVVVPPWLAVDVQVSAVLGNVEERHRVPPDHDPSRPILRFVGNVRLGNLEISTRLPGESARDARRRERRERKRLRGAPPTLPHPDDRESPKRGVTSARRVRARARGDNSLRARGYELRRASRAYPLQPSSRQGHDGVP